LETRKFTENVEMYLKTIYLLEVATKAPARTGAISKQLSISPASVTEMLDRMQLEGLVKHRKYKGVVTTTKGRNIARWILKKHCLIERFLIEALGIKDPAVIHEQADAMEHILHDDIAMRLGRLVKVPKECPDCYDLGEELCGKLAARGKRAAR
jgi:DtxR family Mn-dependent transcriptional regulator